MAVSACMSHLHTSTPRNRSTAKISAPLSEELTHVLGSCAGSHSPFSCLIPLQFAHLSIVRKAQFLMPSPKKLHTTPRMNAEQDFAISSVSQATKPRQIGILLHNPICIVY